MDICNKNCNFTSWPGLTELAVEIHLSKSSATVKGHLNQKRMNARSTIIKEDENCCNKNIDLDNGIKTNCIYAATINAGQICTDQTGRFPVVSSKGKKNPAKEKHTSWYYMSMMAMSYLQNPSRTEHKWNYCELFKLWRINLPQEVFNQK
jgi:hypothetical protein